jgi:ABC-type multidrug transport system fused ATPase/permease subunit
MQTLRGPTQEQAGALIGVLAVMLGAWVRLLIPWLAGFPVNDGGLFYSMLKALHSNGLRIPDFVQYNGLSIPFAYPPLGFYAGVLASALFKADLITVLQWLPAVILIATLPALYFLAKSVLGTSFAAGLATLVYAFTPRAITWQVMGGGLTRSLGQLFLILALTFIYRTFTKYSPKEPWLAILCSSLVVLSHPEAALQTVGLALVLWLLRGCTREAALHALAIGAGTLLLSSVWWLPAVLRYGIGTLLSAGQTGMHSLLFLAQPFLMNFVDEPLMTLISVLGVIGIAYELARHRLLLPLWFVVPFLVEPRSAPTVATVPLALLSSVTLTGVVLPALAGASETAQPPTNTHRSKAVSIFILFIALYMLGNASYYATQMAGTVLSPATREAFTWVRQNTPPGSRFLVLTGNTEQEVFCDATLEWFPALTGRVSVTTVQGREWLQGDQFSRIASASRSVAACLNAEQPLVCVSGAPSARRDIENFDYIYVARIGPELHNCRATGTRASSAQLHDDLKGSARYTSVYENDQIAVFAIR